MAGEWARNRRPFVFRICGSSGATMATRLRYLAPAVLLAALLMETRDDGRVALIVLPRQPLPELCLWRRYLGRSCPSCGLTRSVVAAVHGQWTASIGHHVLGLPLTLAAGALSLQWLAAIVHNGARKLRTRCERLSTGCGGTASRDRRGLGRDDAARREPA